LSVRAVRIRAPFDLALLGARTLSRALDNLNDDIRGPLVLHVWSPTALAWCMPLAATGGRRGDAEQPQHRCSLLVEMDGASDAEPFARRYRSRPAESRLAFVCPTAIVRRRLLENGVAADDCTVIREFVDFAAINEARNQDIRAELGLDASDTVVAALPPVTGGSGTFTVAWATLLLSKMHPGVRLLVPGVGPEADRVQRLVDSVRYRHVARFVPRLSLPALLAATDLTAYLPDGDAPVTGLVWAMAAARPIVATAVPAVAELLAHGQNAWLCLPNSPKDAARRMLQALDQPEQSRRQAELARSQVFQVFGRQRMIEQYAQAYANLAAGRDVGAGIRDSAMVG
jgi:glycosyltransferase involved in cell wall biosynthesis